MPRRKAAVKREVHPDPVYGSLEVTRLMNVIMESGKKSIAEKIVYGAMKLLVERGKKDQKDHKDHKDASASTPQQDGLAMLKKALHNIAPTVEVKSRRVGGATYQVPVDVNESRRTALAMRWLTTAARKRSEQTMVLRLAGELLDALQSRGGAIKVRDETHRMAEANQAFAHYRW